jgi:cell division inhibitor SepF
MSIWDSVKRFTRPYGEDEYDDYDDGLDGYEEEEAPRRSRTADPEPAGFASAEPAAASSGSTRSTGFSGQVLNMNSGNKQEVVLFHPASFSDCTKAADDLRDKKGIIVNLENVDKALSRRVVDFLTGCAYALDGKVNKIAQSTYLFSPHNMNVVGDLESLQAEAESYI